ncbi:MAG: hypoxanthine phosphoribosyltransferase [Tissierellia bacterium]|nr:hypoxanthine phosphoribosyltransferase [Tissierellia bacterium]
MNMDIVKKVLISEEQIRERVKELGAEISKDYEGESILLVGTLKGAVIFLADLAREITVPCEFDFMSVKSYGHGTISSGDVRIIKDLDESVTGKNVLLVEDIIDSGRTLDYLTNNLSHRGAKSIKIVTFLDKHDRREIPIEADYIGFEVPNEFVIGYGLDYAEIGRNYPFIAALKNEVYEK